MSGEGVRSVDPVPEDKSKTLSQSPVSGEGGRSYPEEGQQVQQPEARVSIPRERGGGPQHPCDGIKYTCSGESLNPP